MNIVQTLFMEEGLNNVHHQCHRVHYRPRQEFRGGWRPWFGVILIGVFALFAAIGNGVFPVNNANPDAMTNMLHGIGTIMGFLSTLVGIPLTECRLAPDERWPAYHTWKAPVGIAC